MPVCDHFLSQGLGLHCAYTPMRAPRLVVCSKTPAEPGHLPLKMFTTMHFCELHKGTLKLEMLLQPRVTADFEKAAKLKRPLDFKCDFEPLEDGRGGTFIEWVLMTTPEYRRFEAALGQGGILRAAMGVTRMADA